MSDRKRWQWVQSHQGEKPEITVFLDNDETFIEVGEEVFRFDKYIGDSEGIFILLSAIGICSEGV